MQQGFFYISYVRAMLHWKTSMPTRMFSTLRFHERLPAIAVFISNCQISSMVPPRSTFILKLSKFYPVHHYGGCSDPLLVGGQQGPMTHLLSPVSANKTAHFSDEFPGALETNFGADGNHNPGKLSVLSAYRYTFTAENSFGMDYVTEKVYDALASGAVPIYLGAPNFIDFIPAAAAVINFRDFSSIEAVANYLRVLDNAEDKWLQHHEWRSRPPPKNIVDLQSLANYKAVTLACRICGCVMGILCPSRV